MICQYLVLEKFCISLCLGKFTCPVHYQLGINDFRRRLFSFYAFFRSPSCMAISWSGFSLLWRCHTPFYVLHLFCTNSSNFVQTSTNLAQLGSNSAQLGSILLGSARLGSTWLDSAQCDSAQHDSAQLNSAWL